jgi:ABC-type polysaccharide/polyol phosphate transport system ATPase subunit
VCFIIQKHVRCSQCKSEIIVSGNPNEVIKIKCPVCGSFRKVTFLPLPIETKKQAEFVKVIETHKLTKNFGSFTAVKELNLSVNKGEIYGLIGPNGSGKTTIIKMICGLLKPSYGEIKVLGKEICRTIQSMKI